MKKITKVLVLLLAIAVLLSAFASCQANNDGNKEDDKADSKVDTHDTGNTDGNESDTNGDDPDNSDGDENETTPADKDPNAAKAAYEAAGYTVSLTYVYTDGVIALLTAAKSTKDFANVYYFENEATAMKQYTEFLKSANEITSSSAPDDLVAYKSGTMACWGSSVAVSIMK